MVMITNSVGMLARTLRAMNPSKASPQSLRITT